MVRGSNMQVLNGDNAKLSEGNVDNLKIRTNGEQSWNGLEERIAATRGVQQLVGLAMFLWRSKDFPFLSPVQWQEDVVRQLRRQASSSTLCSDSKVSNDCIWIELPVSVTKIQVYVINDG